MRSAMLGGPLITIVGATGTGKSQLAVALAKRFNGEIINGDALQLYDGLPIATNKIPLAEREGIPHHLLGCIGLKEEPWTVSKFTETASQIIANIQNDGKIPILVGGTHYYTQSLLMNETLVETGNERIRTEEMEKRWPILAASNEEMLEALEKEDPEMAARWHPRDGRKIRRSLEIYLQTGRKASDVYAEQRRRKEKRFRNDHFELRDDDSASLPTNLNAYSINGSSLRYQSLILWIHADSDILKERLNHRVTQMMTAGLLDEVQSMRSLYDECDSKGITIDTSKGISGAIGYKEFETYLKALRSGQSTDRELAVLKDEGIDMTKIATRQYAKRQVRWIRLKLIPGLRGALASDRMFLLDGSDLSCWSETVEPKAYALVNAFLHGMSLPDPSSLSDTASIVLAATLDGKTDEIFARTCETCATTMMTAKEWEQHLTSRKHRATVRQKARGPGWNSDPKARKPAAPLEKENEGVFDKTLSTE
ncbi:hypothetical protein MMC09_006397 [Bachmanniomyces sp. S44760]|nr:hypothetical protein [Bachmanniomyces sp. S44760]